MVTQSKIVIASKNCRHCVLCAGPKQWGVREYMVNVHHSLTLLLVCHVVQAGDRVLRLPVGVSVPAV